MFLKIDFDHFEADDCLTVLMFSHLASKSLNVYAVRWVIDTSKLD